MKHVLFALCLFMGSTTFAIGNNGNEQPKETTSSDCTVILKEAYCVKSNNIVVCYTATYDGKEYFLYVLTQPRYGGEVGYSVNYDYKGKYYMGDGTYETKGKAISAFVKSNFGSACKYAYE